MIPLVQAMQAVSGAAWLAPALYLLPRVFASWRANSSRAQRLSAKDCFISWLLVGFSLRWFVWPHAMGGMKETELMAWAALYALSAICAGWFFSVALQTRRD